MESLCADCKYSDVKTARGKLCALGVAINNGTLDTSIDPYLAEYNKGFSSFPMVEVMITDCEKYESYCK
jgi:hypothetical protein